MFLSTSRIFVGGQGGGRQIEGENSLTEDDEFESVSSVSGGVGGRRLRNEDVWNFLFGSVVMTIWEG